MILFLVSLLTAQPATAIPAEQQQEMEVIGRRLANWRVSVRQHRNGTMQCNTVQSSGDPDVDALGCQAMVHCYRELRPALIAAAEERRRERRSMAGHPVHQQLSQCVQAQNDQLTAALAERRYQQRQTTGNEDER